MDRVELTAFWPYFSYIPTTSSSFHLLSISALRPLSLQALFKQSLLEFLKLSCTLVVYHLNCDLVSSASLLTFSTRFVVVFNPMRLILVNRFVHSYWTFSLRFCIVSVRVLVDALVFIFLYVPSAVFCGPRIFFLKIFFYFLYSSSSSFFF